VEKTISGWRKWSNKLFTLKPRATTLKQQKRKSLGNQQSLRPRAGFPPQTKTPRDPRIIEIIRTKSDSSGQDPSKTRHLNQQPRSKSIERLEQPTNRITKDPVFAEMGEYGNTRPKSNLSEQRQESAKSGKLEQQKSEKLEQQKSEKLSPSGTDNESS